MINNMVANRILGFVSREYGVTTDETIGNSRRGEIKLARHVFRVLCIKVGITMNEVAKLACVERTTIYNSLRYIKNLSLNDPYEYSRYKRAERLILAMPNLRYDGQDIIDKTLVVYLAGAVTNLDAGYVEYKFKKHATALKTRFKDVVNPYELCKSQGLTKWSECMEYLIPILIKCDALFLQPDYTESNGSLHELDIFVNILNKPVFILRK